MPITAADLVKYPFLPKARIYLSRLDLNLKELASLPKIRKLAKQRVISSISFDPKNPLEISKNYEKSGSAILPEPTADVVTVSTSTLSLVSP